MTDLATLEIRIDSTDVKTGVSALDQLTAAGVKAEGAVDRLGDSAKQSGTQIKGAAQQAAEYAAEVQRMAGISVGTMNKTATASKLASHHVQNLAFQFNDLGVQLASGANPMMAFVQQGSQIAGIMGQAGIGVGGLVREVGRMVGGFLMAHPLLLAIGVAAGAASAAIGFMTEEINKNAKVHVTWQDTALGAWDMARDFLKNQLTSAFAYFGTTTEEVWAKIVSVSKASTNILIGLLTAIPRFGIEAFSTLPAAIGDAFYSGVNAAIKAINWLVQKSIDGINAFSNAINSIPLMGAAGLKIPTLSAPQIKEVENSYAGAGKKFGAAMIKTFDDTFNRDFIGEGADALAGYATRRAKARLAAETKAGSKGGGKTATQAAKEELSLYERTMANIDALSEKVTADIAKSIDALANQGLTIAEWGDKLAQERQQQAEDLKRISEDQLNIYLDQLRALEAMEGPAGEVARILRGITTGDFSGIGGKFGGFAQAVSNMVPKSAWKPLVDSLQDIFGKDSDFQKSIAKLLQGASLGGATSDLVLGRNGNGLGAQIGGAIGNKIGEKFLSKGFEKIAKGLGDFAGPFGSIVGGILGGALGGLITKTQWGRVDLTSKGASAGVGNDKSSIGAAVQAGGAFFSQLRQIADAFNGNIGDFGSISIGQRHGDWRVNTGGTSLKVKKGAIDFNDDAEAAIAFAIQTAIERGAITGIRASTQKLLQSSSDLQEKLDKALRFEGVFTELKKRTDPTTYALEELAKQFDGLRKIFDEAGASAAEYAQLEQLLALQRADIETEKLNKRRALEVQLLEAQGKATEALALQRAIELSTTEDWLKNLQQQVYTAQDAAQAQAELAQQMEQAGAKFKRFADDLRSFRESLSGGDTLALSYRQAVTKLMQVGGSAIAGDETALGALSGVGKDFLAAAKDNASSLAQYQRDVAMLTRYIDDAIATADYLAGNPTMSASAAVATAAMGNTATGQPSMAQAFADLRTEVAMLRTAMEAVKGDTGSMSRIMTRVEDAGAIKVAADSDRPLHTVTP